jgi:hypothetical protein
VSFFWKGIRNLQVAISRKTDAVGTSAEITTPTRNSTGRTYFRARRRLLRESFGQFDEDAPVARVLDFSKGNDKPQPFDDI